MLIRAYASKCSNATVGGVRDVALPKISRSITSNREAFWEVMWKKTSSLFAMLAVGKFISMPMLVMGM
jgi:hypothetical protein